MQPAPQMNMQAVMLGQRGGYKRAEHLTAEQRSAISRHAARSRWHPQETKKLFWNARRSCCMAKRAR